MSAVEEATVEYNEIIDVCRKFAGNEIRDKVQEADLESDTAWLKSIWTKSREIGLPGLIIPEEFNGVGQSELCCALALNVLASECAGFASVLTYHFAGCIALNNGKPSQKERFLAQLADIDISEPAIATVLFPSEMDENHLHIKESNGKLLLNGTSPLTGNAEHANLLCIFLEEDEEGEEITCLFLDKKTPGVSIGENAMLPGLKVNPFAPIVFQDAVIEDESIIGERGKGGNILGKTKNAFFGFIAAMATGAAGSAYEKAHAYAEERYQFGKIIINHQEIQRMLGNMLTKLNAGTAVFMQAFSDKSLNLSYLSQEASLAKAFCSDAALEIVIDAVQIHGGYGYMHEYGVEKIMRDCKVLQLIGGSSPLIHKNKIANEQKNK